ncbi:MAG: DEAD/DEAH box helicase [Dysgonamonadaceae bacterium]|jgi:ATP-dependent RNA helicase DeaD|nr:DEAD/DEAH box helicase [Dysgonamonadaceae bacterium]
MIKFENLGVTPPLVRAISEMGFDSPMPVQEAVIPLLLQNAGDIIALAQTGTGKTAAYGLPVVQQTDTRRRQPQTLILCPTRELCLQIASDLNDYSKYIDSLTVLPVYGGSSIESQIKALKRGVHIIVATPGRLLDLMHRRVADLSTIKNVILDEADEMLSMGFSEDLEKILAAAPDERNMLLFSATMPSEIERITGRYMHTPQKVVIGRKNQGNENIRHIYYFVHAKDKYAALKRIVDYYPDIYGIVFCRTRLETQETADRLIRDGYNADSLHGDLTQTARDFVMQKFRNRNLQFLVATDVAARGLDVDDLTHIIHYGLPDDSEIYTHRSGRTARAGKTGISISICHSKEKGKLRKIMDTLKCKFEKGVVPDSKTICEKQIFNFADKIERVEVNEDEIARIVPSIFHKLEWLDKEDIIKRMLSLEFKRLLNYYRNAATIEAVDDRHVNESQTSRTSKKQRDSSRRHLTADRAEEGKKILKLNLGRRNRMMPAQLIDIVNRSVKGKRVEIGRIELHDDFTLFEVDKQMAGQVIDAMNRLNVDGKTIEVRPSEKPGGAGKSHKNYKYGKKKRNS